jgi:hypothetical protein
MILIETLKSGGLAIIGLKISNHSVGEMINVIAPLIAALLVLAGGYSKRLKEIDKRARSYCLKLASIPGEANWLTQELAERTAYNRNERIASALLPELMARENVDACAAQGHETPRLENARERFFDAVYLYSVVCLPPLTNAMHQPLYQDPLGSKYRSYLPVSARAARGAACGAASHQGRVVRCASVHDGSRSAIRSGRYSPRRSFAPG